MGVLDSLKLNGAAAFVAGASRGLGHASALALAEAGADIALGATNEKTLEETANAVRAMGRKAAVCPLDITEPGSARGAVDRAAKELGRLDILVNAAGVCPRVSSLDMSDEEMRQAARWLW